MKFFFLSFRSNLTCILNSNAVDWLLTVTKHPVNEISLNSCTVFYTQHYMFEIKYCLSCLGITAILNSVVC